MKKKKNRLLDPNFVSAQLWELSYIANRFGITIAQVRQAKKEAGKSRKRVYRYIVGTWNALPKRK